MLAQVEQSTHVLVGQSPRIKNVLRRVEKLGRCRWPVLLLGETGTGKEVVARSIHNVNPVGPFVTIDCSSMVGPLMESALFGHVSFEGAEPFRSTVDRAGRPPVLGAAVPEGDELVRFQGLDKREEFDTLGFNSG